MTASRMFKRFSLSLVCCGLTVFLTSCHPKAQVTPDASTATKADSEVQIQTRVESNGIKFEVEPRSIVDGGLVFITAKLDRADLGENLKIKLSDDKRHPFFKMTPEKYCKDYGVWFGIPIGSPAVPMTVIAEWTDKGEPRSAEISITVTEGQYQSEKLKVDPKHVKLSKANLKRVNREAKKIGILYKQYSFPNVFTASFSKPIPSEYSSVFGTKRVYNGTLDSRHMGLDFRAKVGTPIAAPAPGKIVLAEDLFMTGNTVIMDHGFGIYTVYGHMSKLMVKVGQSIEKGGILGLVGATGRASGPHLHWGAVVYGVKVNPEDFLRAQSGSQPLAP